jgi:ferric-dicitrate binding protein FerR (iron transport regulator)
VPFLASPSSSFRSDRDLRGCRARARELGILREFWELVSAGELNRAMGRLALEERRSERRRRASTSALLACCITIALVALAARVWLA